MTMGTQSYTSAKRGPLGPMRVEVHSQPDSLGRCRYTMFWMQNRDADVVAGTPAGIREQAQVFFAVPPEPERRIKLTAKEHGLLVMDVVDVGTTPETQMLGAELMAGRTVTVNDVLLSELFDFCDRDADPAEVLAYRRLLKKARAAKTTDAIAAGPQ